MAKKVINFGPFKVEIEIPTQTEYGQLTRLQERLENPEPMWKQVASIARASFRNNFAVAGPGWKPLAASTIAEKESLGLPERTKKGNVPRRLKQNGMFSAENILIRTGAGRDSVGQLGARGNISKVTKEGVYVGTQIVNDKGKPYMAYHNAGGEWKGRPNPPQREFLIVTDEYIEMIEATIGQFLVGDQPQEIEA